MCVCYYIAISPYETLHDFCFLYLMPSQKYIKYLNPTRKYTNILYFCTEWCSNMSKCCRKSPASCIITKNERGCHKLATCDSPSLSVGRYLYLRRDNLCNIKHRYRSVAIECALAQRARGYNGVGRGYGEVMERILGKTSSLLFVET